MKPQLPSFRAGDEEARDVTTGMRTWQEKQSGLCVCSMGTAPGSDG